jgi:hypothetical protein
MICPLEIITQMIRNRPKYTAKNSRFQRISGLKKNAFTSVLTLPDSLTAVANKMASLSL